MNSSFKVFSESVQVFVAIATVVSVFGFGSISNAKPETVTCVGNLGEGFKLVMHYENADQTTAASINAFDGGVPVASFSGGNIGSTFLDTGRPPATIFVQWAKRESDELYLRYLDKPPLPETFTVIADLYVPRGLSFIDLRLDCTK